METGTSSFEPVRSRAAGTWVPAWVDTLAMPVWVSGPDATLTYFNHRAEALIGRVAADCLGQPCHRVIRGRTDGGRPRCRARCLTRRRLELGREVEPFRMRVGAGRRARWVRVVPIGAPAPDRSGTHLVHCVIDEDGERRFRAYLACVSARSPGAPRSASGDVCSRLSPREAEVIELLASDLSVHGVAVRLDLSYATARNHVQHILRKLGVHSIAEAVARYLLCGD